MIAGTLAFAWLLLAQDPGSGSPAQDLAGRVTGVGAAAGVRVALWHYDMRKGSAEPLAETVAAADGSFAFAGVPRIRAGDWGWNSMLVLARDGERAIGVREVRGDEVDGKHLDVSLAEATTFAGIVRGADGKPVAGASVEPWSFTLAGSELQRVLVGANRTWSVRSDDEGEFVVRGVPAGARLDLTVRHADFAAATIYDAGAAARCEVALQPGAVLSGTVRRPDGRPAARIVVAAQSVVPALFAGRVLTDEQGRYRIASLPEGRFQVWIENDDWTAVAIEQARVRAGETLAGQDFALVPGGWLVGRVLDAANGAAVLPGVGADVAVFGPARPARALAQAVRIAGDGTFRVRVPAGTNRLYLRPGDGWMEQRGSGIFEVSEGEETRVEIVVARGGDVRER